MGVSKKEWLVAILTASLLVFYLYLPIIEGVGWISDDYDLIKRSENGLFWQAQEVHHYSPIVNLFFYFAGTGLFTAAGFHIVAITFHVLNCTLVYWLGRGPLGLNVALSASAMLLFAVAPAGSESLIWCSAIPYVLLTSGLLLGIGIYLLFLKGDYSGQQLWLALFFGTLQLLLFFVWDWAILFFPLLAAAALLTPSHRTLQERAYPLMIALAAWALAVLMKKMLGVTLGYHFNTPMQMVKNLVSAPFVGYFPQFSKIFYTSSVGMVSAFALLIFLLCLAVWDAGARLFLTFFILCQMPQVLMGHPQGRYHYVSMFALSFLLVIALARAVKRKLVQGALVGVVAWLYFTSTEARVSNWMLASSAALQIREEVTKVGGQGPLVIVNLPQWYGKEGIWRPYLWRCGFESFERSFLRVDTPDSGHPESSLVPVIEREALLTTYPNHLIYEVVAKKGGVYTLEKMKLKMN